VDQNRKQIVSGITLILLGLVLFLAMRVDVGSAVVLLLIGGAFLAAYFYNADYGFLVPGCILLGIGAGQLADDYDVLGHPTRLGLGCGFLAIYFIGLIYERKNKWWPLIPGSILVILSVPNLWWVLDYLRDYWPLILIIIGAVLVIGALVNPKESARNS
jgi:hypothetical protein